MVFIDFKGEVVDSGSEWIYDWYGIQAVTPKNIQKALNNANGDDVTLRINSGGGSVFAGCEIYNMLKNYNGNVTCEIHGICASIASVVAMAGTVKMSPVAQLMIHNVSCRASGDYRDMEHTAEVLKNANTTIANAYKLKTGLEDKDIKTMMDHETWFTAEQAKEKGLIDEIMYSENKVDANMVNLLKNSATKMCNSVSLSNDLVEKFKNFKPVNNKPIGIGTNPPCNADFLMQKNKDTAKMMARLKLLNMKRGNV